MANILIIDENDFYREFLSTAVSRQGHAAFQLASGQDVVAAVSRWNIDLVLASVIPAPSVSFAAVRALKDAHPELPVITLADEVVGIRGLNTRLAERVGASCALSKSVKPAALMASIARALSARGRRGPSGQPPADA